MSDYPDRDEAKRAVKILIDAQLKAYITGVASQLGTSSSHAVECAIFMTQCDYETSANCSVIEQMRELKARRFTSSPSWSNYPEESRWHLTVDRNALRFCKMLMQKYPMIFDSQSMAVCLCLAHARHEARGGSEAHLLKRLNDVMDLHPVRALGSKPFTCGVS